MNPILFNINDAVKVQLTDFGRECIKKNYENFKRDWEKSHDTPVPFECVMPKEDEEGWSTWQLWILMEEFGQYVRNGYHVPFNTTIQIIPK